jgi:type III pantothenate kinase
MRLVIDIGNTRFKAALFKGSQLIKEYSGEHPEAWLQDLLESNADHIQACCLSSVSNRTVAVLSLLEKYTIPVLIPGSDVDLPFINKYQTINTLGQDRIAAVAGACHLYPSKDVLIIDAGTAITYDIKTRNEEYLGGNISPGLSMRFRALHEFTSNLPLLQMEDADSKLGTTTNSSIISGIEQGLLYEVEGYIQNLGNKYPEMTVLLTGGDSHFFDNKLKKPIFVVSNLTLFGLNFILGYNAEKF